MNEIKEMYGSLVAKKTVEITEGFDSSLQETDDPDVLSFYDLKPGYFLYVGTAKQHKNVQMLIDAHAKACISTPLIVVTNGKEVETLKTHGGVRVLLGIENDELATLYSCAGCFVTASLYEGFCLPILEARACGCPVIASNTSAIPEVAGAHALLVDPTTDSLAGAFKNPPTLSDPPDKKYNWSQSAAQLADILAS
jgi:glycosyltransferase involved in cell wall biosynthesis